MDKTDQITLINGLKPEEAAMQGRKLMLVPLLFSSLLLVIAGCNLLANAPTPTLIPAATSSVQAAVIPITSGNDPVQKGSPPRQPSCQTVRSSR